MVLRGTWIKDPYWCVSMRDVAQKAFGIDKVFPIMRWRKISFEWPSLVAMTIS